MPIAPYRGVDVIGQALMKALGGFGSSVGQCYQQGVDEQNQLGYLDRILHPPLQVPNATYDSTNAGRVNSQGQMQGVGITPQENPIVSPENIPQIARLHPQFLNALGLLMQQQEANKPKTELQNVTGNLYGVPMQNGQVSGKPFFLGGGPDKQTSGIDIPGFNQMSPATQAQAYNTKYGTNYTAKDFANQFRPPAPVVVNTGAGPQLLNKGTGTVSPIKDAGGNTVGLPPTAEMRNRVAARTLVKQSVDIVKGLGDKIITKVGPAQRAEAIKRGAAAVFGNDPEFKTYQDAREALAGNLAVAQQGSRPSDADIQAIWLPLVPDPYSDTKDSSERKWKIINAMSFPLDTPTQPQPSEDDPLGILPEGGVPSNSTLGRAVHKTFPEPNLRPEQGVPADSTLGRGVRNAFSQPSPSWRGVPSNDIPQKPTTSPKQTYSSRAVIDSRSRLAEDRATIDKQAIANGDEPGSGFWGVNQALVEIEHWARMANAGVPVNEKRVEELKKIVTDGNFEEVFPRKEFPTLYPSK